MRGWKLEAPGTTDASKTKPQPGLIATLGLQELLKTANDAAGLVALLRARVGPGRKREAELKHVFEADIPAGYGTQAFGFSAFKLAGVADTTFVWCVASLSFGGLVDYRLDTLSAREGTSRRFRLLLCLPEGSNDDAQAELNLPRFLALRARLRAALPALARVSDVVLLILLAKTSKMCGTETLQNLASHFAFLHLLPGYPDRGDGQPTEAERQLWGL